MKNQLAKNAVLNSAKTVLSILFPLITYPYVSRVLGAENLGIYNFSFSFLSYFLLIANLGVSTYGIREGTKLRYDKTKFEQFFSEIFSINIISTILSYILLVTCLFAIPSISDYKYSILTLSIEILFATLGVSWVCNVYEDFFAIAVRTIGMQVVSLALIFIFVRSKYDLYKYLVALLVSNSGANFLNFFYIRNKYTRFRFTFDINWREHLKPILIIFSTTIAVTVYVSSDTTMLGVMTNNFEVGLYGTAVKIYTIIKNVLAAVLMVMIPQFTLMFSNGAFDRANHFFSKVFNILTLLMLPICVGLFALSDDIVLLISGVEFAGAAKPLRLLSIAITFSLYSYMYTQCVLIPAKKERIVFKATAISALTNIILNLILIPLWGICAAAFTTIIAEFLTFVISFTYSKDLVKLIEVKRNLLSVMLGCASILLICYIARGVISFIPRMIFSLIFSAIGYFAILILTQNTLLLEIKHLITDRQ